MNKPVIKVVAGHALVVGGVAAMATAIRDLYILHKKGLV